MITSELASLLAATRPTYRVRFTRNIGPASRAGAIFLWERMTRHPAHRGNISVTQPYLYPCSPFVGVRIETSSRWHCPRRQHRLLVSCLLLLLLLLLLLPLRISSLLSQAWWDAENQKGHRWTRISVFSNNSEACTFKQTKKLRHSSPKRAEILCNCSHLGSVPGYRVRADRC